jgi:acyl-CoA synthetase (AMP-forming)/AMP-acid ligase II
MNMAIFGSRAVLMVRTPFGRCPACNDYFVDVINVSGHRLSTAEIESALIMHKGVAETAVIGTADELTGQAVFAFVTLKPSVFFVVFLGGD